MNQALILQPFAENHFPLAAYSDPEAYSELTLSGRKITARHRRACISAASVASALHSTVTDLTWAMQHENGWYQYIQGGSQQMGSKRVPNPLLTENRILNSLCSTDHFAVGTKDGFQFLWTHPRRLRPQISAIRIDLDADDVFKLQDQVRLKTILRCCRESANIFDLPSYVFATGRRGLQLICPLPGLVHTAHGIVIGHAIKGVLKRLLPSECQVNDFKDGVQSIMRLPLMLHARGHLGLFVNDEGEYMQIDEQIAIANKCFRPVQFASGPALPILVDNILTEHKVSDYDALSGNKLELCTAEVMRHYGGPKCYIEHSTPAASEISVGPQPTQRQELANSSKNIKSGTLIDICDQDVEPGDTYRYLTKGYGVWAHQMVYEGEAEARLIKKMQQIPGDALTILQRIATVKSLISSCRTYGAVKLPANQKSGALPKTAHPDDEDAAQKFVDGLSWRKDRSKNAEMVRVAELHIRRFARPDDALSAGDCHRVSKLLFGRFAPNCRTVERIFWSKEFMNARTNRETINKKGKEEEN